MLMLSNLSNEEEYLKRLCYKVDELEVKILDCIYKREMYVFPYLIRKLKAKYHIKQTPRTIQRRLKKLEKIGLIKLIPKTSPLCFKLIDKKMINKLIFVSKKYYKIA